MSITIPRRKLGGLEVSAIGLGCMGMSDFYGPSDEATNLNVLNAALDIGINFLDTADMYGVGANERLLGKVLKARRNQVVLATKFGIVRQTGSSARNVNGSPEYVRAACEASRATATRMTRASERSEMLHSSPPLAITQASAHGRT